MNINKVNSRKWPVGRGPCKAATGCIHPSSFSLHPSFRHGISLLEVLISIGVLAVGLLSILMVIPLGQMTITESIKNDRTSACGKAIERQLKVKRMLDWRYWTWEPAPDNSTRGIWGWAWVDIPNPINNPTQINRTRVEISDPDSGGVAPGMANIQLPDALCSFVVDPIGRNPPGLPPLPDVFYLPQGYERSQSVVWNYPPNNVPDIRMTPLPVLPRRTMSPAFLQMVSLPTLLTTPWRRPTINGTAFIWPDDLALDTPENAVERPFINSSGLDNSRSWDYSYLFTVTPASSERDQAIPLRRYFDVTVVVFFKRLFTTTNGFPDGEWMADVTSISGMPAGSVSPGGGTIQLGNAYRTGGSVLTGPQPPLALSYPLPFVREGQWVMLWDAGSGDPQSGSTPHMGNYTHGRLAWYRVVGVNFPDTNDPSNGITSTLTLDGPDWIVTPTTKLLVIDGAIGAYTSTVELDFDPLWQGMK